MAINQVPTLKAARVAKSLLGNTNGGTFPLKGCDTVKSIRSDGSGLYISNLQITPTNQELFPKLVNIHQSFEQFSFNSVKVEFVSAVGLTSSGGVGTGVFAYAPDPADVDVTSSIVAMNLPKSKSFSLYATTEYGIPLGEKAGRTFYLDSSNDNRVVTSIRESSPGIFVLIIEYNPTAFPTDTNLGYLKVDYDLMLHNFIQPIPGPSSTSMSPYLHTYRNTSTVGSTRSRGNIPYCCNGSTGIDVYLEPGYYFANFGTEQAITSQQFTYLTGELGTAGFAYMRPLNSANPMTFGIASSNALDGSSSTWSLRVTKAGTFRFFVGTSATTMMLNINGFTANSADNGNWNANTLPNTGVSSPDWIYS